MFYVVIIGIALVIVLMWRTRPDGSPEGGKSATDDAPLDWRGDVEAAVHVRGHSSLWAYLQRPGRDQGLEDEICSRSCRAAASSNAQSPIPRWSEVIR